MTTHEQSPIYLPMRNNGLQHSNNDIYVVGKEVNRNENEKSYFGINTDTVCLMYDRMQRSRQGVVECIKTSR